MSGRESPLLVPSFSSTTFPKTADVRLAMNDLKSQVAVSSLISAYDAYHGYIDKEVGLSDVVIIDSGNYERHVLEGLGCSVRWTRDRHSATINSMVPLTQIAIVNYDEPGPLSEQADFATDFFKSHPEYATDFLCRPLTTSSPYTDMPTITKSIDLFSDFDVFGVTEEELGPSLIEKCKRLLELRQCLNSQGLEIPIHVFGCFEPMTIVLMSILGGDIFDGLTWARYDMREELLMAPGSIPFFDQKWSIDDSSIRRALASHNLSQMTELMIRLRSYARTHAFSELHLSPKAEKLARSLLTQVTGKSEWA